MTRVIVVDDHEANVYYLTAVFEGHGYTVVSARHGAEALLKARGSPPDLIVSDLLMPVMDGYTLLRHWRADSRLKHIPFVVYTATYTSEDDERLAYALGADSFILKPCEPDTFVAKIHEVAERARTRVSPRALATSSTDPATLALYNSTLIRKLEEKSLELEESNRALRQDQSEILLRDRAIQAVSQGIVITDPQVTDNPVTYASPGFTRLTGYTAEDVLGKNCRLLQGPETDRTALAELKAAVAEGRECTVEFLNYRKDGTPFWNHLVISPVRDEHEKLVNFVGLLTDVSERRELEAQLRHAQKMEAVGRLAAGVAHDFNNLLSVVLGYSQCALDQLKPGEPLHEDIEQISLAGERATELVKQLLTFSRKQIVEPRPIDVAELLFGMEKMLRRLLGEDIDLALFPASRCFVHLDPTQLEQVVMNLAVNARDAMPEGGKLSIETSRVDLDEVYGATHPEVSAGSYVMLAVSDTGAGMTAEVREHIFEPFFTTKDLGKGTGLGLSTVFGIVKQSHGHVWVYSEPGHGTTFKLYFPRLDEASAQLSAAPPPPLTLRGTETVLVVEDDEQVGVLASQLLQRNGYRVHVARNAGEAILISEQSPGAIDLLLTDVILPKMNGRQLAERLRPAQPSMRVLFMSGYTEQAVVHQGVLDPAIAFIQKPLTPTLLLRKAREVLNA